MNDLAKRPPNGPAGSWRRDFLASLVVFLVALPLCMGIALASGAPVAAGLMTGIVGGLVVGFLAGAPLQVSGPAAGLTVLCAEVIREHGLPALGVVVIIGGLVQLAAGLARLGQWFRAVSPAVIHGMLSGIGVLIVAHQIHVLVDDRPREGGLTNLLSIPAAVAKGLPLPTVEPPDRRQARTRLLREFGVLHERQTEIESHAGRLISRRGIAAEPGRQTPRLADYIGPQRTVLAEFQEAREAIESTLVAAAEVPRDERLTAAVDAAGTSLDQALADLKEKDPRRVAESLPAASRALAEILNQLKSHDWAAKVGLLSILVIVLWQAFAPQRLRVLPAPLVAIAVAMLVAWWWSLPVLYVEVPDRLYDGLTPPALSVLRDVPLRELIEAGIVLAVIASAETLLCATAVDRLHTGPRTHYDRELAAQGLGNVLCGAVGALPMTGVIVRSATNVQAGATSRLSAILHGVWLLVFVALCSGLLRLIPIAALAGILVYTGLRLIDWHGFAHHWRASRVEALIMLTTLVVVVTTDLLSGVVTGVVLSAVKLLVTFSHLEVRLIPVSWGRGSQSATILELAGAATFLRLPLLAARLEEIPVGVPVRVECERLRYIDEACLELLGDWVRQREAAGAAVAIDWDDLRGKLRRDDRPASAVPA